MSQKSLQHPHQEGRTPRTPPPADDPVARLSFVEQDAAELRAQVSWLMTQNEEAVRVNNRLSDRLDRLAERLD